MHKHIMNLSGAISILTYSTVQISTHCYPSHLDSVNSVSLPKPFDKDHKRLTQKTTNLWSLWPNSSLDYNFSSRNQRVLIYGAASYPVFVSPSVPQGKVFGPLLFLNHKTDLPVSTTNPTVRLFANDCLIY